MTSGLRYTVSREFEGAVSVSVYVCFHFRCRVGTLIKIELKVAWGLFLFISQLQLFILPCLFVLDTICDPSACVKIGTVIYCNVCAYFIFV